MSGFDHPPTPIEKRASASYLLGWIDALYWAMENRHVALDLLCFEMCVEPLRHGPLFTSVVMKASDSYDAADASPEGWVDASPHLELLEIQPDPDFVVE